jgi:hypothetical protein
MFTGLNLIAWGAIRAAISAKAAVWVGDPWIGRRSPVQVLDRYASMACFRDPKMCLAPITRINC